MVKRKNGNICTYFLGSKFYVICPASQSKITLFFCLETYQNAIWDPQLCFPTIQNITCFCHIFDTFENTFKKPVKKLELFDAENYNCVPYKKGERTELMHVHVYFHHFAFRSFGIKDFSLKATLQRQTPLDTNVPSKQDEQASLKRVAAFRTANLRKSPLAWIEHKLF
jgi:hypothetical protein